MYLNMELPNNDLNPLTIDLPNKVTLFPTDLPELKNAHLAPLNAYLNLLYIIAFLKFLFLMLKLKRRLANLLQKP